MKKSIITLLVSPILTASLPMSVMASPNDRNNNAGTDKITEAITVATVKIIAVTTEVIDKIITNTTTDIKLRHIIKIHLS
ncbi:MULTISPECIES: hypothetical protein [unclassified Pseudoalteromonas]|uniref:hypothetical protein n=1 Tax=unclassified Pseudoalteromonas TaxID=194690 RepID=UPI0005A98D4D|nr:MULTISPECIES: hypothetical protein [unclassified Pseudoalteromonas]